MTVRFPDGTIVNGLALPERKDKDSEWDYGLYLDAGWRPTWPATVVDWEDYGLPATYEAAAEQIREAFRRAKSGQRVEVGYKGGCGRTGTVLACMAILSGVQAGDAVAWIRANYRRTALPAQRILGGGLGGGVGTPPPIELTARSESPRAPPR